MTDLPLLSLALRSAWNRRFALGLVLLSIALSTLLLLGIERLRRDVRDSFAQAVSGTDLIVGARSAPVSLLLYAVFHLGSPTQAMRSSSLAQIEQHPAVDWVVPLALGDSHRGFPVLATDARYWQHLRHGNKQPLSLAEGRLPSPGAREAVLGAQVARQLGYRLGQRLVLAHGDGALAHNDHADQPFTVVGVLADTGTPVDRTVHIDLAAMDSLHGGAAGGMAALASMMGMPALGGAAPAAAATAPAGPGPRHDDAPRPGPADAHDHAAHDHGAHDDHDHDHAPAAASGPTPASRLSAVPAGAPGTVAVAAAAAAGHPAAAASAAGARMPRTLSAALVGLKQRQAVFAVQRDLQAWREEPLSAILPGVALDELWQVVGLGEQGLQAVAALVAVVSLAGLVAVVLAGLDERRRELAILRAVGAGPRQVMALLALEGALVTAAGVLLGALGCGVAMAALKPWVLQRFGLSLGSVWPGGAEWLLMAAVLAAGWLASLVPGWRAYRLSLADGLAPRI